MPFNDPERTREYHRQRMRRLHREAIEQTAKAWCALCDWPCKNERGKYVHEWWRHRTGHLS